MANLLIVLLVISCYGMVHADFNAPFRPEAQFSPRYSAGSGDSNYNTYNGADNSGPNAFGNSGPGPNGGDNLAAFGLGGLSGFYSSLSSELINAGNNFGASPQDAGNAAVPPVNNNLPVTAASTYTSQAYQTGLGSSNNNNNYPAANVPYANANPQSNINLGDNGVLKQYGLEQLGSFFGSMVSELNNAGSNGGVNGAAPANYAAQKTTASKYATQSTTTTTPSSTTYAEASR